MCPIKLSFSDDDESASVVVPVEKRLICLHNLPCEFLAEKPDKYGANLHCEVTGQAVFERYYEQKDCPIGLWWRTKSI